MNMNDYHCPNCGGPCYDGGGSGDGSGVKAFLCVVGGFLLMVFLLMGLGVETGSVPPILLIIVWFVFAGGLAALFMSK